MFKVGDKVRIKELSNKISAGGRYADVEGEIRNKLNLSDILEGNWYTVCVNLGSAGHSWCHYHESEIHSLEPKSPDALTEWLKTRNEITT
jgi:hypothetical protein